MSELLILGIWFIGALGAWLLGYHYGAQSLRDRNKKLLKSIEENNRIYKDWATSSEGSSWEAGYAEGIKNTLDTLNSFLERAT